MPIGFGASQLQEAQKYANTGTAYFVDEIPKG
jgi:hypothetical protein